MDKRTGKRKKQFSKYEQATFCLDTLFEQFIHAKLAEGRSKRTIDQYRENIRFFLTYLVMKLSSWDKLDTIGNWGVANAAPFPFSGDCYKVTLSIKTKRVRESCFDILVVYSEK